MVPGIFRRTSTGILAAPSRRAATFTQRKDIPMTTNRQWLLAERPEGMVGKHNFEFREGPVPELQDGEVLVRNLCLSFDPTQRLWMEDAESYLPPVQIGGAITPAGHEPAATQSRDTMILDAVLTRLEFAVVWHNVDRRIVEACDISAVHTIRGKS